MSATRPAMALVLGVILTLSGESLASAALPQQAECPLEIEIVASQTSITVGAPVTWFITFTPDEGQDAGRVELLNVQPGDAWAWPDGLQITGVLTRSIVRTVSAVPLVSGDLVPILVVQYSVAGESREHLVMGHTTLEVAPVESQVEVSVTAWQGVARKGDRLPLEVWIHNRSPFVLTQVEVTGAGTDLAWERPVTSAALQPDEMRSLLLHAQVAGGHPRPDVEISYAWTDGVGDSHTRRLKKAGGTLQVSRVLEGAWDTIIGVLAGGIITALSSFAVKWVEERRQRKWREEDNRHRVLGLLRLMTTRSECAIRSGVPVELDPVETVFEQEGLFAAAKRNGLDGPARDLWGKAANYNDGLNRPGGMQRLKDLAHAAAKLRKRLEAFDGPASGKRHAGEADRDAGERAGTEDISAG